MPLMKQVVIFGILVTGSVPLTLEAQVAGVTQDNTETRVDYESVRREIQNFESAINDVISGTFSNPFGLVNRPKGVYLPGYGDMFTFLVNIQRAVIKTPWGEVKGGQPITPAQKKQRIEELTDKLVRALLDQAGNLTQLHLNESVAIVAFFEDRNFPDEGNQSKTIVLSASKKDLEEWSGKPERWKEFKQRMKIIEY